MQTKSPWLPAPLARLVFELIIIFRKPERGRPLAWCPRLILNSYIDYVLMPVAGYFFFCVARFHIASSKLLTSISMQKMWLKLIALHNELAGQSATTTKNRSKASFGVSISCSELNANFIKCELRHQQRGNIRAVEKRPIKRLLKRWYKLWNRTADAPNAILCDMR